MLQENYKKSNETNVWWWQELSNNPKLQYVSTAAQI